MRVGNINHVSMLLLFMLFSFGRIEAGLSKHPLLLLISFDGFRWDYLKMYDLPNFELLKNLGSHAEFINNSFSTVTFPNHWTIVTGLYEETHGIVQNLMYDPVLNEAFIYMNDSSQTKKWYGQNPITNPIWTKNQKAGNGRRSAAEWVGSGVEFDNETIIHIPFNRNTPYEQLIDNFIGMFKSNKEPINFGALYFDEPDHTGHNYGPYSVQMKAKLKYLDTVLGYLIKQLKSHGLFDRLNLIITSDHGMEQISPDRTIYLDSHIDTNLFNAYGSRPVYSIFVKNASDIEYVYKTLKAIDHIDIYKKDEIPESLHYKHNVRIGDLLLVAHIDYAVYINNITVDWSINNGDHGYYNNQSSMYPIFIAHGPAFKKNFTIKPFNNVDIYPLMCLLLGLEQGITNGSLHNVYQMVAISAFETQFNFLFILLAVVPILFVFIVTIFLCIAKRNSPARQGYTPII